MESFDHRSLVSQLAEDLTFLEQHAASQPALKGQAIELRYASGLVRNSIGPFLDRQPPRPLHLAVVGGAGTGKSTIVNLLCGQVVAEANPQAGFTRHPIAYVPDTSSHRDSSTLLWSSHLGFLGDLQRISEAQPSDLDEDVYQIRHVFAHPLETASVELPGEAETPDTSGLHGDHAHVTEQGTADSRSAEPSSNIDAGRSVTVNAETVPKPDAGLPEWLQDCVIWDCPDMTTTAATSYVTRLLEVAALADVLVYVASDERYNDRIPTEFLYLLIRSGKPVVVCLTKMQSSQASAMLAHFQSEVLGRAPHWPNGQTPMIPCLAFPFLAKELLEQPLHPGLATYRVPLINQIMVLTDPNDRARRRTVQNGLAYLQQGTDGLLWVARQELQIMDQWRSLVEAAANEFSQRYRNEFLLAERYQRFDDAFNQLIELLELPNAGRLWSAVMYVLRAPYRLLRSLLGQVMIRPESVHLPQKTVLEGALAAWFDGLRNESLQRAHTHSLWKHIAQGFQSGGLGELARERFQHDFRRYELHAAEQIEGTRLAITRGLVQNSSGLWMVRFGKLALDLSAVVLALVICGLSPWLLLVIPLLVSLSHQAVESVAWMYVNRKREQARVRQETALSQYLTTPMREWLCQWPVTGGSTYERLQRALRRIPEFIRELGLMAGDLLDVDRPTA